MTKRRRGESNIAQASDPAVATHKAFRRMAFMLANLVTGIWLVLLISAAVLDQPHLDLGSLALLVALSVPIAYLIPYGLVRAIGFVMVAFRHPNR